MVHEVMSVMVEIHKLPALNPGAGTYMWNVDSGTKSISKIENPPSPLVNVSLGEPEDAVIVLSLIHISEPTRPY